MNSQHHIDVIVTGRVQMVMFRDFIQRMARGLRLVGFVENKKDGSVHAVAEGERKALEQLIEQIKRGPILARVDDIEVRWGDANGHYEGFHIKY